MSNLSSLQYRIAERDHCGTGFTACRQPAIWSWFFVLLMWTRKSMARRVWRKAIGALHCHAPGSKLP